MAEILPIRADHSRSNDAERNERTRSLLEEAAETTGTERQRLIDEVVLLNLRLAESIAKRYSGRGIERDDLVQVANVGLVNAAQRFDPGMGKDFYSYAVPTITGEVKRYFRDHGWTVRPPRRVQDCTRPSRPPPPMSPKPSAPHPPGRPRHHLDADLTDILEATASHGCFTASSIDYRGSDGDETPLADAVGDDWETVTSASSTYASSTAGPNKKSPKNSASPKCKSPDSSPPDSVAV